MGYEYTNGMGAVGAKTDSSTATATLTQLQQRAAQAAAQIAQARTLAAKSLSQAQASVLATAQNQLALLQEQIRAGKVTATAAVAAMTSLIAQAAKVTTAIGARTASASLESIRNDVVLLPVQFPAATACRLKGGLWNVTTNTCVMPSISGKQQFTPGQDQVPPTGGGSLTPQAACVQQGYPWFWNDVIGQCVDFSAQVDATVDSAVDNTFIDETIDEEEEGTPPPVVALPAEPVDWKLWGAIGLAAGMVGYALYKGRTPRGTR